MAMAVVGAVEEQQLDYHAPLISVRRHYSNLTLDVESFSSARSSDVGEDMAGEKESAADFGRSPGAVPFFWEREPGVAKPEVVADYSRLVVPAIGHLRPPPATGRSFSPTPAARAGEGGGGVEEKKAMVAVEEKEVEEKTVETVKPASRGKSAGPRGRKQREPVEEVASTRAFAERVASRSFFGEIALSAISERPASPGRVAERRARASCGSSNLSLKPPTSNSVPPSPGSGQKDGVRSDEIEVFADASESLPQTSYTVNNGWEGRLGRQPVRDADQREYILQRFLPAAAAAHGNADHGGRGYSSSPSPSPSPRSGPGLAQRQGIRDERPIAPSPRPASRFAAVKKSGKPVVLEDEDEGDDGRVASTFATKMGCGLLPRVMGRAMRQSAPCFPFKTRAKAKPKMSPIPSSFPSGNTTFDDDSQFDDAYSEFWDEEEEEEFLDRRLMEVREDNQLKVPGRSPPIGAPRFISGVPDKFQFFPDGEIVVATTNAPGNGYLGASHGKLDMVPVHKGNGWVDKESQSSSVLSSSSTSPESHIDGGNQRASPTLVPLHYDGRGFLGLPTRTPESELVPSRAAAYREYFHHEPRSSDRGGSISSKNMVPGVDGVQGRNKLEDFLRVERWNRPEGKDVDVQSWINHSPIPNRTIIDSRYVQPKEGGRICESSERAQSSRSSGETSFSDSEGQYFMSDVKSSETSSGISTMSTEQDDSAAASAGKGWPLCQVQSSGNGNGPDKEAPAAGVLQLAVPPLPPSPSESWLWANLSPSAALNSQKASQVVLCKKYFDHGGPGSGEPTSKWQLMVQSGNSKPADRLRCSEELTDSDLLMWRATGA